MCRSTHSESVHQGPALSPFSLLSAAETYRNLVWTDATIVVVVSYGHLKKLNESSGGYMWPTPKSMLLLRQHTFLPQAYWVKVKLYNQMWLPFILELDREYITNDGLTKDRFSDSAHLWSRIIKHWRAAASAVSSTCKSTLVRIIFCHCNKVTYAAVNSSHN